MTAEGVFVEVDLAITIRIGVWIEPNRCIGRNAGGCAHPVLKSSGLIIGNTGKACPGKAVHLGEEAGDPDGIAERKEVSDAAVLAQVEGEGGIDLKGRMKAENRSWANEET